MEYNLQGLIEKIEELEKELSFSNDLYRDRLDTLQSNKNFIKECIRKGVSIRGDYLFKGKIYYRVNFDKDYSLVGKFILLKEKGSLFYDKELSKDIDTLINARYFVYKNSFVSSCGCLEVEKYEEKVLEFIKKVKFIEGTSGIKEATYKEIKKKFEIK